MNLCESTNAAVSNVAFRCLASICLAVIRDQERKSDPAWKTLKEVPVELGTNSKAVVD